jgi:hypothetical protein
MSLKRTHDKIDDNKSINIDDLDLFNLLKNRNVHLIFDKINNKIENQYLPMLCYNVNMIDIIKNNLDKFTNISCWINMCKLENIHAIRLIADNVHKLSIECWIELCSNEAAIPILETHIDIILKIGCLPQLCLNKNAIHLIKKYTSFTPGFRSTCADDKPDVDRPLSATLWVSGGTTKNLISSNFCHCNEISYPTERRMILCENCWINLCFNINAIDIIKNNLDKMTHKDCWEILCSNINAIDDIILNNLDKLTNRCWLILCKNPNAIELLKKNPEKINKDVCFELCTNPNPDMCDILEEHIDSMTDDVDCWYDLTENYYNNPSPKLLDFIEKHSDKISYSDWLNSIWASPDAMTYIERNISKLENNDYLYMLCTNKNAIHIIEQRLHEMDAHCWERFCSNINAIPIILNNLDKLNTEAWKTLSTNPNIIHYL